MWAEILVLALFGGAAFCWMFWESFKSRQIIGLIASTRSLAERIDIRTEEFQAASNLNKDQLLLKLDEIKSTETSKEETKKMLLNSLELLAENSLLKDRQKEYYQFFGVILQTLKEDTEFLHGNLVRGFSMDIPQVREFNSQILNFQNRVSMIKEALKQNSMVEELEDAIETKEDVKVV